MNPRDIVTRIINVDEKWNGEIYVLNYDKTFWRSVGRNWWYEQKVGNTAADFDSSPAYFIVN